MNRQRMAAVALVTQARQPPTPVTPQLPSIPRLDRDEVRALLTRCGATVAREAVMRFVQHDTTGVAARAFLDDEWYWGICNDLQFRACIEHVVGARDPVAVLVHCAPGGTVARRLLQDAARVRLALAHRLTDEQVYEAARAMSPSNVLALAMLVPLTDDDGSPRPMSLMVAVTAVLAQDMKDETCWAVVERLRAFVARTSEHRALATSVVAYAVGLHPTGAVARLADALTIAVEIQGDFSQMMAAIALRVHKRECP